MKFELKLSKTTLVCLILLPITACALSNNCIKDSLGLDKSIRIRHLANGFTYYLKPNEETDKIYFDFYVKVGNYNERLSQYQFAHLVEHLGYSEGYQEAYIQNDLAFKNKSTKTYTSANAANTFTTFYSSSHANDSMTIRNRLQWFYDITNMAFEDSYILREARCLRQEVFSRSKGMALNSKFNKSVYKTAILYNKSGETPYSSWLSNYDMGGISVSSVREFYHQWYRPNRMGLVITGNIQNIDELEQFLINLYGQIPPVKAEYDGFELRQFYLTSPPRFKVIEKKEVNRFNSWNNQNSKILFFFRVKKFNRTLETKNKWINKQLYQSMYRLIHQRLEEKDGLSWHITKGGMVDVKYPDIDYPYFRMPALITKKGVEQKTIQRVTGILQQLYTNGFTQKEWDNQKKIMLNQIDSWDITTSKYWKNQLKNHFVYGEILPEHKKTIIKKWINNLTLNDINSYLKENFSVMPNDIYITASAGHPALSFTESQVRGWIKDAIKNPLSIKEIVDISSLSPLEDKSPFLMKAKEIDKLKEEGYKKVGMDDDTGLEILELANGVKIILNQKELRNNSSKSISIMGYSPRGASFFPRHEYYSAISATEIIELGGAGGLSRKTIRNKLGIPLSSEPVKLKIHDDSSTVSTRIKLENLEKYLQLIYIYFTSPLKDSLAFTKWQAQTRMRYLDPTSNVVSPMSVDMKNAIADFLRVPFLKVPTNLMSTEQYYQKQNVELEKAIECYQTIFGNPSDFTFTITGGYNKEKILPLLQKYIGNLPVINTPYPTSNIVNKTEIKLPKGPIYHTFYADKMNTSYKLYTVPYALSFVFEIHKSNWKDRAVLNLIRTYLLPKVIYELRYINGKSLYSAYSEGKYSETDELYNLAIYVDGLGDELESIRTDAKNMIAELVSYGISPEERDRILIDPLFFGRYASTPLLQEKIIQYASSLTTKDIRKVARKYLKKNHQYEFAFKESKNKSNNTLNKRCN